MGVVCLKGVFACRFFVSVNSCWGVVVLVGGFAVRFAALGALLWLFAWGVVGV